MNTFQIGLLYHFAAVQRLARKYGVEAHVNMANGILGVRAGERMYRFFPQYIDLVDGLVRYTPRLNEERVRAFLGWRPYFNKRWPIAVDKLEFKDFCRQHGLRTPAMWREPSADMRDYLVKRAGESFGEGMHGPFKAYEAGTRGAQASAEDGYYEAFIAGRIVKASYWNDALVALELKAPPRVTGDGKRRLRELIGAIVRPSMPADEWHAYAEVAAYQGLGLDSVPPAGQAVLVDFRYGTYAEPTTFDNLNELRTSPDSALIRELRELGPTLWQGIPEELRDCSLYTIDAVADAQDRAWLLEMNCNPVCHPDCYDPMFATLFGAPGATVPAPVPRQSALPSPNSAARLPAVPTPAVLRTRGIC